MEIKELKENYEILGKKYSLPEFDKLEKNFELDKIEHETNFLLRTIRKIMMEKIINSLGFVEMLLNPMNAPQMYLSFLKSIGVEEKKSMDKIYNSLGELTIISLEREIDYDEKKEAEFIAQVFSVWTELKSDFLKILRAMKKPAKESAKKERSYLG